MGALEFVIDRLNTSASLYRIAPCLSAFSDKEHIFREGNC